MATYNQLRLTAFSILMSILSSCGPSTDAEKKAAQEEELRQKHLAAKEAKKQKVFEQVAESSTGQFYAQLADLPGCTKAPSGMLFYVVSLKKFYVCENGKHVGIDPLLGEKGDTGDSGADGSNGTDGVQGEKGEKGDTGERGEQGEQGETGQSGAKGEKGDTGETGAKGDKGEAGAGIKPVNLSVSSASNATGTNVFATGTGFVAPTNLLDAVDSVDFGDGENFVAPSRFSQATLGLNSGFGCFKLNLTPALGAAGFTQGTVLAKIGLLTSTGSQTAAMRWESSMTGAANSYLLQPNLSAPITNSERIFYPVGEVAGKSVQLCVQGSTSRNIIVRLYQVFLWE
jgi:hypothetical protein